MLLFLTFFISYFNQIINLFISPIIKLFSFLDIKDAYLFIGYRHISFHSHHLNYYLVFIFIKLI